MHEEADVYRSSAHAPQPPTHLGGKGEQALCVVQAGGGKGRVGGGEEEGGGGEGAGGGAGGVGGGLAGVPCVGGAAAGVLLGPGEEWGGGGGWLGLVGWGGVGGWAGGTTGSEQARHHCGLCMLQVSLPCPSQRPPAPHAVVRAGLSDLGRWWKEPETCGQKTTGRGAACEHRQLMRPHGPALLPALSAPPKHPQPTCAMYTLSDGWQAMRKAAPQRRLSRAAWSEGGRGEAEGRRRGLHEPACMAAQVPPAFPSPPAPTHLCGAGGGIPLREFERAPGQEGEGGGQGELQLQGVAGVVETAWGVGRRRRF